MKKTTLALTCLLLATSPALADSSKDIFLSEGVRTSETGVSLGQGTFSSGKSKAIGTNNIISAKSREETEAKLDELSSLQKKFKQLEQEYSFAKEREERATNLYNLAEKDKARYEAEVDENNQDLLSAKQESRKLATKIEEIEEKKEQAWDVVTNGDLTTDHGIDEAIKKANAVFGKPGFIDKAQLKKVGKQTKQLLLDENENKRNFDEYNRMGFVYGVPSDRETMLFALKDSEYALPHRGFDSFDKSWLKKGDGNYIAKFMMGKAIDKYSLDTGASDPGKWNEADYVKARKILAEGQMMPWMTEDLRGKFLEWFDENKKVIRAEYEFRLATVNKQADAGDKRRKFNNLVSKFKNKYSDQKKNPFLLAQKAYSDAREKLNKRIEKLEKDKNSVFTKYLESENYDQVKQDKKDADASVARNKKLLAENTAKLNKATETSAEAKREKDEQRAKKNTALNNKNKTFTELKEAVQPLESEKYSFVMGSGNTAVNSESVMYGTNNTATNSDKTHIYGDVNTVKDSAKVYVAGTDNKLDDVDKATVVGRNNHIHNSYDAIVLGENAHMKKATGSILIGSGTVEDSVAKGTANTSNAIAIGKRIQAGGTNNVAIGSEIGMGYKEKNAVYLGHRSAQRDFVEVDSQKSYLDTLPEYTHEVSNEVISVSPDGSVYAGFAEGDVPVNRDKMNKNSRLVVEHNITVKTSDGKTSTTLVTEGIRAGEYRYGKVDNYEEIPNPPFFEEFFNEHKELFATDGEKIVTVTDSAVPTKPTIDPVHSDDTPPKVQPEPPTEVHSDEVDGSTLNTENKSVDVTYDFYYTNKDHYSPDPSEITEGKHWDTWTRPDTGEEIRFVKGFAENPLRIHISDGELGFNYYFTEDGEWQEDYAKVISKENYEKLLVKKTLQVGNKTYHISNSEFHLAVLDWLDTENPYVEVSESVKQAFSEIQKHHYDYRASTPTEEKKEGLSRQHYDEKLEKGGVVSVGDKYHPRQIVYVANGIISPVSTDAVNGSQLYTVIQDVRTVNATAKDAKATATANAGEISAIKAKDTAQDGEIASLKEKVATNKADLAETKSKVSANTADIKDLKGKLDGLEGNETANANAIRDLQEKESKSAKKLVELDEKTAKNASDIAENKKAISTNKTNLDDFAKKQAKKDAEQDALIKSNGDAIRDNRTRIDELKKGNGKVLATDGKTTVELEKIHIQGDGNTTVSLADSKYTISLNKQITVDSVVLKKPATKADEAVSLGQATNVARTEVQNALRSYNSVQSARLEELRSTQKAYTDATGARLAAASAMAPLDYDKDSPTVITAGVGHQGGKTAFALGLWHYRNQDQLFNLQASYSDGWTVGAGLSLRLKNKK